MLAGWSTPSDQKAQIHAFINLSRHPLHRCFEFFNHKSPHRPCQEAAALDLLLAGTFDSFTVHVFVTVSCATLSDDQTVRRRPACLASRDRCDMDMHKYELPLIRPPSEMADLSGDMLNPDTQHHRHYRPLSFDTCNLSTAMQPSRPCNWLRARALAGEVWDLICCRDDCLIWAIPRASSCGWSSQLFHPAEQLGFGE